VTPDDLQARLARRSTLRRAVGLATISAVIVLSVLGRSVTEATPRSALGGTELAVPVEPTGAGSAPAQVTPTAPGKPAPTHRKHAAVVPTTTPKAAPRTTPPSRTTPLSRTPSAPRTASAAPTTTAPVTTQRTVVGAAYDVSYGTVQLQVKFRGHQIVDITALSMPEGGRSGDISARAEPQLRREALTAQSANINAVSGASYTSAGYARSLQSAIDKAGV
jgi:uncharacterized protein with FMN-binding domain